MRFLILGLSVILGDPGAVSRVGRKGGTKVFITGERAPGYRLSTDHFQKFKRMPAPDWAQKMLCIIVPNRRTHLNKFFSCVLTWRLLSRSRLVCCSLWVVVMQSRETQITMVKWTNAGVQTKRANERSFVYRPPAWRRWRNVKTTYALRNARSQETFSLI